MEAICTKTNAAAGKSYTATCIFSVLFIIAHLIGAIVLCRERLFLDTAYYFFRVVSSGAFRVEHQRIILVLSQVLLWAGVKLHLSFMHLILIYSITPILYTAILIFIALYFFRSAAAAWMLICCNVCGTYFLYYSPMYEVCYAIVTFGFLWFLTVRGYYHTVFQMLIYVGLLALCLLGYPLIAIGCAALFSYMWIYEGRLPRRMLIAHVLVFSVWALIKIFWISDYERAHARINAADHKIHEVVVQVFSVGYIIDMVVFAFTHYFLPFVAVGAVSFFFLKNKKYGQGIWPLIALLSLLIFMGLKAGGDGLVPTIHNERSYLIMVPICLAPLLFFAFDRWSSRMVLCCMIVLMSDTIYESIHTWQHSNYYSLRLMQMDTLADNSIRNGCTKLTSPVGTLPPALNEWSTGIEVMIRSTERGKSVAWVDKEVYDSVNVYTPITKNLVLLSMNIAPLSPAELNSRYFTSDTSAYCIGK